MLLSETVTFGGSGLNRAAELRNDAAALARMLDDPTTRIMILWRGKPLFADAAQDRLLWLSQGHALLADAGDTRLFMGRDDAGAALFAADISRWRPDVREDEQGLFDTSAQTHPLLGEGPRFADLRMSMALLSPREAELAAMARGIVFWHQSHRFCSQCGVQSDPTHGGWQRICPSCGAHHFPRSDPVAIMLVTHGNSVLVGRAAQWPAGMFSLLAGYIEPGETIEGAVRREVYEESGVRIGAVEYLASQPWPFPSSLMIGCKAEAISTEISIDPNELEEALWITREDMAAAFAGQHPRLTPARQGAIAQFLLRNWLADRLD